MEGLMAVIQSNNETVTLAALGLAAISVILGVVNTWRTGTMLKKYNKLMQGVHGRNLEERLTGYVQSVHSVLEKTREVEDALKVLRRMVEKSVQNVGIVRYNAFDDTGSDLSFALALLDHKGDGVVVSSLFGRTETRIYAKPVTRGASTYTLSDEEAEAISKALANQIR